MGFPTVKKLLHLINIRKEFCTMYLTEQMIEQLKADLKTAKTFEDLMSKDGAIKKLNSQNTNAVNQLKKLR